MTRLNAFKKKPEKEDLLSLYGYYKQGTAGDVNIGASSASLLRL